MRDIHRLDTTWFRRKPGRSLPPRPPHHSQRRRLWLEPLETRALLSTTTWTVNSLGDTGTGSGQSGDLRYCITQADQTQGDNTISFSVTGTITLNSALPDLSNTTGLMDIEGPGSATLIVTRNSASGTPDFSVFTVDVNIQAKIAGLTVSGTSADSEGVLVEGSLSVSSCTIDNNDGIGISDYKQGTLTVTNSSIESNGVGINTETDSLLTVTNCAFDNDSPGILNWGSGTVTGCIIDNNDNGIDNEGVLAVSGSIIDGNTSGGVGGGIGNDENGVLSITSCTIDDNSGTYGGGGIWNIGSLTVYSSAIDNNFVGINSGGVRGAGGGISNGGYLTVSNSTIAYNTVTDGDGGGIANGGSVWITDSVIAYNSATAYNPYTGADSSGGGIENTGTLSVANCTIAGNSAAYGSGIANIYAGANENAGGTVAGSTIYGDIYSMTPYNIPPSWGYWLTVTNCTIEGGIYGYGVDSVGGSGNQIGSDVNIQSSISTVAVDWGTRSATLQTASDGLRLLPAGRNTDLPWMGINQFQITLSQLATLAPGDITVIGSSGTNYGPVTVSGSGTSYTITLARPINSADRVTITIANDLIATYTRQLDVLPGDVNDDGVVNVQDLVLIRNQMLGFMGALPTIFGDINGDGKVDINDFKLEGTLIGTHL